jgi:hypothetical protein
MIEQQRGSYQNQIYEDGRYIVNRIAQEISGATVDYDEYYNQNVVSQYSSQPTNAAPLTLGENFGQNFGRYYSAFFHPGDDRELGFLCSDNTMRNNDDCIPQRKTLDRQTGENPFTGKYSGNSQEENAFCGSITYEVGGNPIPQDPICNQNSVNNPQLQNELYLISADGNVKTIFAREKVGENQYALSFLRLNKNEETGKFECAAGFNCLDVAGKLPRTRMLELNNFNLDPAVDADIKTNGFSADFIPLSPLRVNIKDVQFYISPIEDPHYAYAEDNQIRQPRVTMLFTIKPDAINSGTKAAFCH